MGYNTKEILMDGFGGGGGGLQYLGVCLISRRVFYFWVTK